MWHENIALEVAAMFRGLCPSPWSGIEDALYTRRHYRNAVWEDHGKWWRKTAAGRRYQRVYSRVQYVRRKETIVAVRACASCGVMFSVNMAQDRKNVRVCSFACRARRKGALITVDGKAMPLVDWAKVFKIKFGTVWMRIKRGWDAERALKTPLVGRG